MSLEQFGYKQELRRTLHTRDYFIRGRSGDWLRHVLCPLAGLAVIAYVLWVMDASAKLLGGCWVAIGGLYYARLTFVPKKPASLET